MSEPSRFCVRKLIISHKPLGLAVTHTHTFTFKAHLKNALTARSRPTNGFKNCSHVHDLGEMKKS